MNHSSEPHPEITTAETATLETIVSETIVPETGLPTPQLTLSPSDANAEFENLQQKLVPLWESMRSFNLEEQTIVVVPSIDVDIALTGSLMQAYEERFLFMLLLLRQPRARLIYVTSQMIHPAIVEYYLGLL